MAEQQQVGLCCQCRWPCSMAGVVQVAEISLVHCLNDNFSMEADSTVPHVVTWHSENSPRRRMENQSTDGMSERRHNFHF